MISIDGSSKHSSSIPMISLDGSANIHLVSLWFHSMAVQTFIWYPYNFRLYTSIEDLFWSMFGYGDRANLFGVLFANRSAACPANATSDNHKLTIAVGKLLYAFYHIIMVLVLLNTLIALLANTLTKIKVGRWFLSFWIWYHTLNLYTCFYILMLASWWVQSLSRVMISISCKGRVFD